MIRWVVSRGVALAVGAAVLLVIYRLARPAIHRAVPAFLHAQAQHLPAGSAPSDELDKRVATIEDLLDKLLRAGVIAGLIALVLAVFDLWSILAGLVLIIAAVMVSSQEVVLDYVMGFLILVEGPYFKGDWIGRAATGRYAGRGPGGRTAANLAARLQWVDERGVERSIRASANVTRVYSVAVVEVQILKAPDVERAITAALRATREMQADAAWSGRMVADDQPDIRITAMTIEGAELRIQNRVVPGARMAVSSELRRRLIAAFMTESVGTARWDTPLPTISDLTAPGSGPTS